MLLSWICALSLSSGTLVTKADDPDAPPSDVKVMRTVRDKLPPAGFYDDVTIKKNLVGRNQWECTVDYTETVPGPMGPVLGKKRVITVYFERPASVA